MTTDQLFVVLRDAYSAAMWALENDGEGDFAPFGDLDQMELRDVDGLIVQLETVLRAARRLKDQAESQAAFIIGDGGAARVGGTIYRHQPKLTTKVTDPKALADWLGTDWSAVVPLTASTQLRKGGVKAICEKRGTKVKAFWETFTETTEGAPGVKRIPIDYAPQFLQKLKDGETV